MSPQQVRQLLGIASARTVKNVMMNHFFTINGKLFRQKDGSPIGLDLSVEIASIYMTLWDKKFLATLRRLGIQVGLYKRYVDDTVVILNGINPGWYYCPKAKKMCHDMNHRNVGQEEDARTFGVLREIANSLDTDIQMTVEVPSDFADRRLPVMDLALWVNDNQVQFSFFKKPMSSPYVNMWRSAISKKTKRDSLLQEGLRRYRNMGQGVDDAEKRLVLSRFMNQLRISGFDHQYRYTLLKGILKRQAQIEEDIREGKRIQYRSRDEITRQKEARLGKHTNTWFLKNDVINTLKI